MIYNPAALYHVYKGVISATLKVSDMPRSDDVWIHRACRAHIVSLDVSINKLFKCCTIITVLLIMQIFVRFNTNKMFMKMTPRPCFWRSLTSSFHSVMNYHSTTFPNIQYNNDKVRYVLARLLRMQFVELRNGYIWSTNTHSVFRFTHTPLFCCKSDVTGHVCASPSKHKTFV